ncbi:nickel pincer cofactor biosynthesis protein LarB [Anaerovorax odorimutans]|uniref:nickel pincer cofactor biosynthesis protein LarB n=1 Tax=Anaerovorax odorimutans TaxID=109327 RepID=UPI000406B15B|nr:nickel pincer cofactor biosynthesis protein LarB [Anaerovorax odorimutans]
MDNAYLEKILNQVATGETLPKEAMEKLKDLPFQDLEFVKIDQHRNLRTGYPEVIFCQGKTKEQVTQIIEKMMRNNSNIIATRASKEIFDKVKEVAEDAFYYEIPKVIVVKKQEIKTNNKVIAVVTAGTADIPVAEEAAVTAEIIGNKVERIYDVGVAGIHRLFARIDKIRSANVVIVVAGMEGALASVVGGLVDKPVIAVPTSIGYGASFGGISALLTMLNSCAAGVGVVNIDNGFGAGYLASNINRL